MEIQIQIQIQIQREYSLSEIINFAYYEEVEEVWDSVLDGMALFISCNEKNLNSSSKIYLDYINPEENKDNVEGYSQFILHHNLNILCLGDIFLDVIDFYKSQKTELNNDLIIKSLKYYLDKDDFLELE